MTVYPIQVTPLTSYYGDEPSRKRKYERDTRTAAAIEKYINQKMEVEFADRLAAVIHFGNIASALNIEEKLVRRYLCSFSGSSDNAIEISRAT